MASKTEEILSRALRTILADLSTGANIPASEQFRRDVLTSLCWWLPSIFGEVFPEWSGMCLDGIYPALARKTGDGEAEILGQCIFIEDQTLTPIHLRLQLAPAADEVSWLEFKVGERLEGKPGECGKHGMKLIPYLNLDRALRRIYRLDGNADDIDWVYKVTFGNRRLSLSSEY